MRPSETRLSVGNTEAHRIGRANTAHHDFGDLAASPVVSALGLLDAHDISVAL
jgi:hypothetical protein